MTVFIAGINGFLGTCIASALQSKGISVVGLDVAEPHANPPWPTHVGDVCDGAFVRRIMIDAKVSDVLHCGGISGPHVCNDDPPRVFNTNVGGTLGLFELAKELKIPGRVILFSSSSVYGRANEARSKSEPLAEGCALLASEPYGASKVASEAVLRAYADQEKIDAVALRISIVYGPGRTTYCGITNFIKCALAGQPLVLDQDCDLPLPWLHIGDAVDAVLAALDAPRDRIYNDGTYAYNVTGPGSPTFREIARSVADALPGTRIVEGSAPDKYAMNARQMALSAIKRDLGWEPRVSIEEGVRRLVESLSARSAR